MRRAKKLLIAMIVVPTLMLSGCAVSAPKLFQTTIKDSSTLSWKTCHKDFQCATLKVPIDYASTSAGTFDIAVIRYRDASQHNRLGSLVINPGGPGVSGIEYALNAQYIVNPGVLERYDIVGFDPRGIGASTSINCLNAAEKDVLFASDPKPDNAAEYAKAISDTQTFVNKCVAKTKNLEHFSTFDAAHDMELLRQGLGDSKLNYLGFSYGTYLGTLYAQQFPNTVGKFVLDGAIDPSISIEEQSMVQATAFDHALANFIADCPSQKNCPLPANATTKFFTDLFKKTAANPLLVSSGTTKRKITEALVVTGTASALYDNAAGWPLLRIAITQALKGDGTTFAKLADAYNGRNTDGTYSDNQNDANIIIDCLDWHESLSNEAIRANADKFAKVAPVFGPYVAYSGITCNLLNATVKGKKATTDSSEQNQTPIKETSTPVLIIGTTQDPATPYAWAQALARYIKGSRLITMQGEGHTGYGRGSACVDDAVDAYLTTGQMNFQALECKS